ncbi:V-set and immunoglobulin domain-containing protein 10-like [Eleutherodactylus coqui]|uniref:V-set and immunoglobulin domain-containing protein 10-like n=1 Tax=Eleutherodactylus coqui TaxID=57060 RepID=UPI0034623013
MTFNGTPKTEPNIVFKIVSLNGRIQGSDLTCSGDQLGRTSTCTMTLEPPYSSGHNNDTVTEATEGQTAVLRVTLGSKSTSRSTRTTVPLPATFVWYRYDPGKTEIKSGGKFIVTSTDHVSTLNITDVTPADAGKYECTATNLVGSQSSIFNLTVTTKAPPPQYQWNGGEIAGIVIGTVAIIIIIILAVIVFITLRQMKKSPQSNVYENTSEGPPPPQHQYERTLPGIEMATSPESNYEQLMFKDNAQYHTLVTTFRK